MRESNRFTCWHEQPAAHFMDAYPLGNGRIGAMLYGGALEETIQVDEQTFWSGCASDENDAADTWEKTVAIRRAILEGDLNEADRIGQTYVGNKGQYGTNLPVGNLKILMSGISEKVTDYKRRLNIRSGLGSVQFRVEGTVFNRDLFVSNPADLLVLRQTQEGDRQPFDISLTYTEIGAPVRLYKEDAAHPGDYLICGDAFETRHSDGHTGAHLEGRIRVRTDGSLSYKEEQAEIHNATWYILFMDLRTNLQSGEEPKSLQKRCLKHLDHAETQGYDALLLGHRTDVETLFDRVRLCLGDEQIAKERAALPTDKRIREAREGAKDPDLAALLFSYGRYLLIASSRENSPLPTHMGGIWNDNIYCNMDCCQDFHLDMNIQMQYQLASVCRLPESMAPLTRWVKSSLLPSGRRTADTDYHAGGFCAHVVSNPWGFSGLGWSSSWGVFAMGGVWTALLLWDQYAYTGDVAFLRDEAWPILREAAAFAEDYLFEDPATGLLQAGPSYSPENHYKVNDKEYTLALSNTCDVLLIREILTVVKKAGELLGLTEESVCLKARECLEKLPPYRIGADGRLLEWSKEYEETDPYHRHTSHLLGLYPFRQITKDKTPDLAAAARASIDKRYECYDITSWGMAMYLGYMARLHDGKACGDAMDIIYRELIKPSLIVVMGDENAMWQGTWELDGNTGITAAMAEMLISSDEHGIELLPALPSSWGDGNLQGLAVFGGHTVDLSWKNGVVKQVTIHARTSGKTTVKMQDTCIPVELKAGRDFALTW